MSRFRVYANSAGSRAGFEIQELLLRGLSAAGETAVPGDEKSGFLSGAEHHLVVMPHEFFSVGSGRRIERRPRAGKLILYASESPESERFRLEKFFFPSADWIWAEHGETAAFAQSEGLRAKHVPLGFVERCSLFDARATLAAGAQTDGLEPSCLKPQGPRWEKRPLDLFFQGRMTARRERFFIENGTRLSRWRGFFPLRQADLSDHAGAFGVLDSKTIVGLARRSKILLNVHAVQARRFESRRLILQGFGQGALIVTEPLSQCAPFEAGKDFIEASWEKIPDAVDYFLSSRAGRKEAAVIAARGAKTLREKNRMADSLRGAVSALGSAPLAVVRRAVTLSAATPSGDAVEISRGGGGRGKPKVTVAVSLCNYRSFIIPCLESVRAQTLGPIDLIVMDDRSEDGSEKTAALWLAKKGRRFSRFSLLRPESRLGLAGARNAAFTRARTPFVFVLDADNLIEPACLERLSRALAASKADFAYSYLAAFGEERYLKNRSRWNPDFLLRGNCLDAMALLRRSSWKALGGYLSQGIQGWEDFDFYLRLARSSGRGVLVPELLGSYRVHLKSMLHSETNPASWRLEELFRTMHGVDFEAGRRTSEALALTQFASRDPIVRASPGSNPARAAHYERQALKILRRVGRR